MVKAIKPTEVKKRLPNEVVEVFNEVIEEKWTGSKSIIYHDDVVPRICAKMNTKSNKLFEKGYLDVEPFFRAAGWKVEYDRPCYYGGDTYKPHWTFSKKPETSVDFT